MYSWKLILKWILSALFFKNACKHTKVNPFYQHEKYCPDCGKRVSVEWHIIRCSGCFTKRSGYHLYDEYIPHERFCKRCGEENFFVEIKDNIQIFEFAYATYKFKIHDKLKTRKKQTSSTKVWLEPGYTHDITHPAYKLKLLPATATT